jgi:hypothetical protein
MNMSFSIVSPSGFAVHNIYFTSSFKIKEISHRNHDNNLESLCIKVILKQWTVYELIKYMRQYCITDGEDGII